MTQSTNTGDKRHHPDPETKKVYSFLDGKADSIEPQNLPEHDVDYRSQEGPRLTYLYAPDGQLHGQSLYLGAEIGCDGLIYCIPGHALRVLVIDPETDKIYQIGPTFPGKFKWLRGIVVDDVIYGLPCNGDTVLRIHVPTQDITTIKLPYKEFYTAENGFSPEVCKQEEDRLWKYHGGAISPKDGCIYVIPQSALHVLKIDPKSDICEFVGPALEGRWKWYGGLIGKADGALYGIPHNASSVLRIDPPHVTTHGNFGGGGHKWHGASASADGSIVSVPANADTVLVIQPQADCNEPKLVELGNEEVIKTGRHRKDRKYKYMGAMAGTDGRVYVFPCGSEEVLQVDTTTMTVQTVGPNLYDNQMERICQNKWQNGLTNVHDHSVYGIPLSGESVLRICTADPDNIVVTTWKLPKPYHLLSKYEGGVVCPNGIMYTVPNNHKAVLRIEPPPFLSASNALKEEVAQNTPASNTNEDSRDASMDENGNLGRSEDPRDRDTSMDKRSSNLQTRQSVSKERAAAMTEVIVDLDDDSPVLYRSGIATLRSSAHRVKASVKHRKQDMRPKNKTGHEVYHTDLPDPLYQEDVFSYDLHRYKLRETIVSLLERCEPEVVGSFRNGERSLDEFVIPANTLNRTVNGGCCESAQRYMSDLIADDSAFLEIFDDLVKSAVVPYMKGRLIEAGVAKEGEPLSFYYQRPPTLRIQPGPGRAGVKPHNDREYGHQNGELNFWLPLTNRDLNKVDLWCESSFGEGDYHPLIAQVGEIISFHGSSCRHFVNRNETNKTRVSMDFRVGVGGFFDPYWQMNGTTDDHGRCEVRI